MPVEFSAQWKKKEKQNSPRKQIKDTIDQAERVAWRILKDWIEVQMALLDIKMVTAEEFFFRTS